MSRKAPVASSAAEQAEGSLLEQIRQRELEISGRVMAARTEADAIVERARREAQEIEARITGEGETAAREASTRITSEADVRCAAIRRESEAAAQALEERLAAHRDEAVRLVLSMVSGTTPNQG